jgi:hypothetical protein
MTEANCPVRLTRPRTASPSITTSWPKTRAVPESGRSRVARIRIVVVFPAPLGPRTPYISQRLTPRCPGRSRCAAGRTTSRPTSAD